MSGVAVSFAILNISEDEFVETGMRGHLGIDTRIGQEDGPGD